MPLKNYLIWQSQRLNRSCCFSYIWGRIIFINITSRWNYFEEKQKIRDIRNNSGAPIDEMNIVRRSLSQIKGGRLAEVIYPAMVTTYMISDIPGDDPSHIGSGPTIQATGKNEDSIAILRKYKINISPKIEEIIPNEKASDGRTFQLL